MYLNTLLLRQYDIYHLNTISSRSSFRAIEVRDYVNVKIWKIIFYHKNVSLTHKKTEKHICQEMLRFN